MMLSNTIVTAMQLSWTLALGAALIGSVWYCGRQREWRKLTRILAALFGAPILAYAVYLVTAVPQYRGATLLDSKSPIAKESRLPVPVEHSGVAHLLSMTPTMEPTPGGMSADVVIRDPSGAPVLEGSAGFTTSVIVDRDGSSLTWNAANLYFTPRQAGDHELVIKNSGGWQTGFHIHVGDPAKRNGKLAFFGDFHNILLLFVLTPLILIFSGLFLYDGRRISKIRRIAQQNGLTYTRSDDELEQLAAVQWSIARSHPGGVIRSWMRGVLDGCQVRVFEYRYEVKVSSESSAYYHFLLFWLRSDRLRPDAERHIGIRTVESSPGEAVIYRSGNLDPKGFELDLEAVRAILGELRARLGPPERERR